MPPKGLRARLAIIGLGVSPAWGAAAGAEGGPTPSGTAAVRTVYQRGRSFRIPFAVAESERPRRREVQLWASDDSGASWTLAGRATPDQASFVFRAPRDGEYWFAARTLDDDGRLRPADGEALEPRIKVVVDTIPPFMALESGDRSEGRASVRWRVRDAHLDLRSLALETQAGDGTGWRPVPIRSPSLDGGEAWDPGTGKALKVRVSVADMAGNRIETVLGLPKPPPAEAGPEPASPSPTGLKLTDSQPVVPQPVEPRPGETEPGGPEPVEPSPPPGLPPDSSPPAERVIANPPFPPVDVGMLEDEVPATPPGRPRWPGVVAPRDGGRAAPDPRVGKASAPGAGPGGHSPATADTVAAPTLRVRGPRFALPYTVDDAGPDGPAAVELWITRDRGRTWKRFGEDRDHAPPFEVKLNTEGKFGLWLVARDASGEGDRPPRPGDVPQMWVEVEGEPPPRPRLGPP